MVSNWLSRVEQPNRRLEAALDKAIRRLALPAQQIIKLPDNYAVAVASKRFADHFNPNNPDAPYLPPHLFDEDGPWVCLGLPQGPTAPLHLRDDGTNPFTNSVFIVFLKLPGGRAPTLDFLTKLGVLDTLLLPNTHERTRRTVPFIPHPEFPVCPKGTEVAIVRRALLLDDKLRIAASTLTESVQIRVVDTDAAIRADDTLQNADDCRSSVRRHLSFESQFRRAELFAGVADGLRDVSHERDFKTGFNSHQWDEFERTPPNGQKFPERSQPFKTNRDSCIVCHKLPGSLSFNSVPGFAFGRLFQPEDGDLRPGPTTVAEVEENVLKWREGRLAWTAFLDRAK